jgi:hypothetical protein
MMMTAMTKTVILKMPSDWDRINSPVLDTSMCVSGCGRASHCKTFRASYKILFFDTESLRIHLFPVMLRRDFRIFIVWFAPTTPVEKEFRAFRIDPRVFGFLCPIQMDASAVVGNLYHLPRKALFVVNVDLGLCLGTFRTHYSRGNKTEDSSVKL